MFEFLKNGGPVMFVLVLTSIVGVTFIIERGLALRWRAVIPRELEDASEKLQTPVEAARLAVSCQGHPSACARLIVVMQDHKHLPLAEASELIQTRARREVNQLERGLVILEIVVGIAPLLGLVGTIHGLIALFGDLSKSGLADNAVLARGISVALNTTLMGLIVAIPSLIAWSYFTKKVENLAIELETICDRLLRVIHSGEKKG